MVQLTLVAGLDGFNRVLACRDTFQTDLVRDALGLGLYCGRPRSVDGELLLVLLSVNSVLDLSSVPGWERLIESVVFGALFEARGAKPPARTTVDRYLKIASPESRRMINEAVYRKAMVEGLDDFKEETVDSTAVEANSAWPTDSVLIWGFLRQAYGLLARQAKLTRHECGCWRAAR